MRARPGVLLLVCAATAVAAGTAGTAASVPEGANNTSGGEAAHHKKPVLTLGHEALRYKAELNLIFLFVVLVTVLLEVGMHFLFHHARRHSKQLLIHLNKELALLGIVAFLLMLVATTSPVSELEGRLEVMEWCHIQLFFMAMLTIVSHVVLNLLLWWEEYHFVCFDHGRRPLTSILLAGWGATQQLHFELARYVFNCDRRKFFSTQSIPPKNRECPAEPSITDGDGKVELVEADATCAAADTSRFGQSSGAANGVAPVELHPDPTLFCDGNGASPMHVHITLEPDGNLRQPPSPLLEGSDAAQPLETDSVSYLATKLQRLRVTPLLVRKLRAAVRDQSAAPDEFSFAQYRVRCAQKGLVKLLHVSWRAWAVFLLVLAVQQLPLQLLQQGADSLGVHITATGCVLFGLFAALWLWVTVRHQQCVRRLAEAALLHYASEGSLAGDDWPQRLEPLLSGAYPQLAKRIRKRVLLSDCAVPEHLKERQEGLYRRSLQRQKKSFWASFLYPRNVILALQVLMLWMGLYFSLFLLTRFSEEEGWSTWEVANWVLGVGVPILAYTFFLPSIMFHHTFLVSVGDMVDLKVMRQMEREHREMLIERARNIRRCRLSGRIQAKLAIMAALQVETWQDAIASLQAIARAPSNLSPSSSAVAPSTFETSH